jgi:hypothetical protein
MKGRLRANGNSGCRLEHGEQLGIQAAAFEGNNSLYGNLFSLEIKSLE